MKKYFFSQNILNCPSWNINNLCWNYDNVSSSLSGITLGEEIRFSTDGTKLYSLNIFSQIISQYNLPTAWYLSGVTLTQTKDFVDLLGGSVYITSLDFSPNGTILFFGTRESQNKTKIYKHTLSTAWDISSATYHSVSSTLNGSFRSSIVITSGGTKMFSHAGNDVLIYQHTLNPAYEVSGITYDNVSIDDGPATVRSIYMKSDGTKLFTDAMRQYDLGTPFDLTTVTASGRTFTNVQSNNGGLHFKSDGSRFFTSSVSNNVVYQYSNKK